MDLSDSFSVDLLLLAEAESLVEAEIASLLETLSAHARATVDSFAGATFVLMLDGHPITFTACERGVRLADVVTSVVLPLTALSAVEPGSMLIIFGSRPGALVDFAADAAVALGIPPDAVALDRHVPARGSPSAPSGLADAVRMNQAIGVLLGRGLVPEAARVELQRLAWMSEISIGEASHTIIASAEDSDLSPGST